VSQLQPIDLGISDAVVFPFNMILQNTGTLSTSLLSNLT